MPRRKPDKITPRVQYYIDVVIPEFEHYLMRLWEDLQEPATTNMMKPKHLHIMRRVSKLRFCTLLSFINYCDATQETHKIRIRTFNGKNYWFHADTSVADQDAALEQIAARTPVTGMRLRIPTHRNLMAAFKRKMKKAKERGSE